MSILLSEIPKIIQKNVHKSKTKNARPNQNKY